MPIDARLALLRAPFAGRVGEHLEVQVPARRSATPPPARPEAPLPAQQAADLEKVSGYSFSRADLAAVMRQCSVGDAERLLSLAMALDDGDRRLSRAELLQAGREATAYVLRGYKASPSGVAAIMRANALREETALLRVAKHLDDGDRVLGHAELSRAAGILKSVARPNDVAEITERTRALAARGVEIEELGRVEGAPILAAHFPVASGGAPQLRVCITGGVHGNEPCGASAALFLAEWLAGHPEVRERVAFTVVPMVNPRGLARNTRQTPEGIDINRTSKDGDRAPPETRSVAELLARRPAFDVGIDLHSGDEARNGFWLIHRGGREVLEPVIASFDDEWPILHGRVAPYREEKPGLLVSKNGGTLKDLFVEDGARFAVTVEAPGSISYLDQVMGEVDLAQRIVGAALGEARARAA